MSAWDKLLAASSLALGTAWQLISSPRTGGGGTVLVADVTAVVAASTTQARVSDTPTFVQVSSNLVAATVNDTRVAVYVPDALTTAHVADNTSSAVTQGHTT